MYTYAWLVLDLFAVLVLLCAVYRCAEKGFVRTVIGFLGYFAAAFAAGVLSGPLAKVLYETIVRDALRLFLTHRMEETFLAQGAGGLLGAIPSVLRLMMQDAGRQLLTAVSDGDVGALAALVVEEALQEPVLSILRGICFFLIFWVGMMVIRRFSWMFGGLYKIPIIGSLNTVLGGVIGVAEAVIILFMVGIALQLIVAATGDELPFLNRRVLDATYVYRVFLNLS